jgi:protein-L-isoaspartate(D-aspartate) O-methyltransferase
MLDSARLRANMVATQLRTNDVTDARLIKAMLAVPRENFVPEILTSLAYMEDCIALGGGRALLDPRSFAKLAQLAAITPLDRLLDIGCATGYSTAVFAHLAARTIGLEQDRDLATIAGKNLQGIANVELVCSRMRDGVPAKSPFDVIFINGAVEHVPESLIGQLADGGRLVCIVSGGGAGQALLLVKRGDAVSERRPFNAQVPVLPGFENARSFSF